MTTPDTVKVRVKSHRASAKLRHMLGVDKLVYWWSWEDGNNIAEIPADRLDDARSITGVTLARPKGELHRCWEF